MKRKLMYLALAVFCAGLVASCNKDDNDGDDDGKTKAAKVKTMTLEADWGDETWEYVYDEQGRTSSIYNYGEDWRDTFSFDYSTAGKLVYIKGGSTVNCDLNAQGLVSKLYWNADDGLTFEYDTDGYLKKVTEFWNGGSEVKCDITTENGNITGIVYKPEEATPAWTKVLTYTGGENAGGVHQAIQQTDNVNDWQAQTNLFGKACKNINTKVQKSTSANPTNITFEFDEESNRITKLTRSGIDWSEVYTYTYYEN